MCMVRHQSYKIDVRSCKHKYDANNVVLQSFDLYHCSPGSWAGQTLRWRRTDLHYSDCIVIEDSRDIFGRELVCRVAD